MNAALDDHALAAMNQVSAGTRQAQTSTETAAARQRPRGAVGINQLQDYASELAADVGWLNNALWEAQRIIKGKEQS
jgi:hypothetical protein